MEIYVPTPFGEEVKRLRLAKKLSQEALATAIGLTQGSIGHLETGRTEGVNADVYLRLCDALGVSCDHFRPYLAAPPAPPAKPKGKPKPAAERRTRGKGGKPQ